MTELAEAGIASQTAADRIAALDEDTRLPVTVLDPDDVGDLTALLGTADTLRVSLILRCGDHLFGRITELIVDSTDKLRFVGFERDLDPAPERGTLVERIRWDAIDYIGRREPIPLESDPHAPVPSGMVRIPPENFTQALFGARAAVLYGGHVSPVGEVVGIQRAVDQGGGDGGYWEVQLRPDGADAYDSYVLTYDGRCGLLVAE